MLKIYALNIFDKIEKIIYNKGEQMIEKFIEEILFATYDHYQTFYEIT